MCELFAVNAKNAGIYNEILKSFFGHSNKHPHGWGMAVINQGDVQIEKEPLQANRSFYLHERMTAPVCGDVVMAHIRYATIGNLKYSNCHPFTGKDLSGRQWTMIHNGTIFDYAPLSKFLKKQQGDTDSERIFLYILHNMNQAIKAGRPVEAEDRFRILDQIVCDMAKGNKINLMIYDSENLYVHTNQEGTLYYSEGNDSIRFSTQPLDEEDWEPVPMTTLLAYQEGRRVFTGTNHENVYIEDKQAIDQLYQIFSSL